MEFDIYQSWETMLKSLQILLPAAIACQPYALSLSKHKHYSLLECVICFAVSFRLKSRVVYFAGKMRSTMVTKAEYTYSEKVAV